MSSTLLRLRRTMALGALIAHAAVACTSPLGPADIAGTYVAVSIAGAPLPSQQEMWDAARFIVADTITIAANGEGTWVEVSEITAGAAPPFRHPRKRWFETERRGSQLYIRAGGLCQMTCDPAELFLLTPVGSALYLRVDDQVRRYERVDAAP